MKELAGTIQLKVRGSLVQIDLTIPGKSVRPKEMIPVFQRMCDKLVGNSVAQSEAEGNPISCRAGCGACCSQLVPLSEGEARYIAGVVAAMPAERQAAV